MIKQKTKYIFNKIMLKTKYAIYRFLYFYLFPCIWMKLNIKFRNESGKQMKEEKKYDRWIQQRKMNAI